MKYTIDDVVQYDNFFDKEDFQEIQNKTGYGSAWNFGHTSYGRDHPEHQYCTPFWKIDFATDTFFKDHLLNKIQEKLETRFKLQHVYANGHTFGTMGDFHRDWNDETGRTFLLYVNNGWSIDWGGHTIFDLGDGKYHYHLPRPNSATFFPGIIPHMAEATSRKFGGLRVTIAWKLLLK